MTKQLRLNKNAIAARAGAMDGAGNELLSSAGLNEDQDRNISERDIFDLP